ncbi:MULTISPECIES: NAD-dependent succinate-semialdehyde dehydrogenase [Acidithiobacillus]|uniref:NAD-dependent succinate-semialdehyde dehydrogenase n=1 Tax=Acidithiobacillus TaxID=119977 RepID=UPI00094AA802|nr:MULTISPECIES: NAD-dependent succinate-semialdehyde dehydrogenase [Acidithiobacillus]MBE7563645.1 NAD-dependent succinate-semialdehyde dehydrogenase [Acidithiobacillus sp. HP-6]MBE7570958.1 NAD-dependent succinate-semialdehyde dehydrogenase [Acidithiobacillus sp. HP-2]
MDSAPTSAFMDGCWTNIEKQFVVRSPSNQQAVIEVSDCGLPEAEQALQATTRAFSTWSRTTAYQRSDILRRWAERIQDQAENLAQRITWEMGKPIRQSRSEIHTAVTLARWYGEECKRITGESLPSQFPDKRLQIWKVPVGPVFAITPWNSPVSMVVRKIAPALAAGCTVILKPDEQTPTCALRLAELWAEAEGPAGTLQVLPSSDPAPLAERMMADPRIAKLSFTGSTSVGQKLYAQGSSTIKRLSLELGGHAPVLVFADADIDAAVAMTIQAKFRYAGQSCVAANRLYVEDAILPAFTARYLEAISHLKVGDPFAEDTDIGPLVSEAAVQKFKAQLQDALDRGARLLCGGDTQGLCCSPTLLADLDPQSRIFHEESFSPLMPIQEFRSEAEAVARANDTPYGLAAYLWTRDLGRAYRIAEALQCGIVGINDGAPATPQAPFGGSKLSGLGTEGGKWGLEEYLQLRYVSLRLPEEPSPSI